MKNMKRVLILVLALIMAFGVVEAASAVSINFTFTDMFTTLKSNSGLASADYSSFFVVLSTASTVSNVNVFGFRARNDSNDAALSSYKTMTYVGKKSVSYRSGVNKDTRVYLNCKKDDSSTYGGPLNAEGSFTP